MNSPAGDTIEFLSTAEELRKYDTVSGKTRTAVRSTIPSNP